MVTLPKAQNVGNNIKAEKKAEKQDGHRAVFR